MKCLIQCLFGVLSSELKSVSQGFASLDYEITDTRQANLVKMDILINDNIVDVLSELVYKDEAEYVAREKTESLKNFYQTAI
jgi:GTP-binding protein LepA